MKAKFISVIVPAYNEDSTLATVVQRLEQVAGLRQIILVDDGSTDGTSEVIKGIANRSKIVALRHDRNRGKGAAIRSAIPHVTGDVVVIQDADLEYNPSDIERLVKPLSDNVADVVYGARFGCQQLGGATRSLRLANQFLTWLSNRFTGLHLTDMETCYKAMRHSVIQDLTLRELRFGFEPEFTAKVARGGWQIVEVPISYQARSRADGKKIGVRDGVRAVWCILRYRWRD